MDVRRDQEDPREQADSDRQDQRIDQRRSVTPRTSPPDEDEQACHQYRVHEEIERIADRRELDVDPKQLRIAVRVEIAAEEEELPRREQPPRRPGAGLVHPDAGDDREHPAQAEQIDQRAVGRQSRREQVGTRKYAGDPEIPDPRPLFRPPWNGKRFHAARSFGRAGWRSKTFTRRPRTSIN